MCKHPKTPKTPKILSIQINLSNGMIGIVENEYVEACAKTHIQKCSRERFIRQFLSISYALHAMASTHTFYSSTAVELLMLG